MDPPNRAQTQDQRASRQVAGDHAQWRHLRPTGARSRSQVDVDDQRGRGRASSRRARLGERWVLRPRWLRSRGGIGQLVADDEHFGATAAGPRPVGRSGRAGGWRGRSTWSNSRSLSWVARRVRRFLEEEPAKVHAPERPLQRRPGPVSTTRSTTRRAGPNRAPRAPLLARTRPAASAAWEPESDRARQSGVTASPSPPRPRSTSSAAPPEGRWRTHDGHRRRVAVAAPLSWGLRRLLPPDHALAPRRRA